MFIETSSVSLNPIFIRKCLIITFKFLYFSAINFVVNHVPRSIEKCCKNVVWI